MSNLFIPNATYRFVFLSPKENPKKIQHFKYIIASLGDSDAIVPYFIIFEGTKYFAFDYEDIKHQYKCVSSNQFDTGSIYILCGNSASNVVAFYEKEQIENSFLLEIEPKYMTVHKMMQRINKICT
jgi:hypothetical protein